MATIEHEDIYPGDAVWYRIPRVYVNNVLLTNNDPPASFTYQIALATAGSSPIITGSLTHSPDENGRWEALFTAPVAGDYTIRATATKSGQSGSFKDVFVVAGF